MPTKLNRAGQQQNYVPQGNGDASGEYADSASGSNKHFTNFSKPTDDEKKSFVEFKKQEEVVKPTETPKDSKKVVDDNGYEWTSQEHYDFYISMVTSGVKNHIGETRSGFVKDLKKAINNSNPEGLKALALTMKKRPFQFIGDDRHQNTSYYYPMMNQIHIEEDIFERKFEQPGTSLFHELGHYMNDNNKVHENIKWYSHTVKLTDAQTIFDDGKSVAETLQEELKEFSSSKVATQIRKDRYKYLNQRLKGQGFTAQEYEALTKELITFKESEEWQSIKQRIKDDYDNGRFSSLEEANKELKYRFEIWKMTGSYKDKYQQAAKWRPFFNEASNEWYRETGIQAVSDVWSSKSNFGFGLGHNREYYKKSYVNPEPESLLADEFFANVFGAYTAGGEKVLETTKKYFPRSYEKVLKLIERVNVEGQKV